MALRAALACAAVAAARARLAVFYSPSTPERGASVKRFLSAAPDGWCAVELDTVHAADLELDWNGTLGAPLYLRDKAVRETHFALTPPRRAAR